MSKLKNLSLIPALLLLTLKVFAGNIDIEKSGRRFYK